MTIANGSPVDEDNTNAGFISRKAATSSSASIITLNNIDPSSGPTVSNLQASVNSSESQIQTITTVLAGAAFTLDANQGNHALFLSANSGATTVSTTPFGASFAGLDGTVVKICGLDDTNTIIFTNNDIAKGVLLNGNITLTQADTLTLLWSETLDRWVELARNQ